MSQHDNHPAGVPGGNQQVEPERLLAGVEAAIARLDELDAADQVAVYDQANTALAEALARTADTGGPPNAGRPGA
ncbi:MAG: hypothetical protein ABJD68_11805 [Nakamurella sp.]